MELKELRELKELKTYVLALRTSHADEKTITRSDEKTIVLNSLNSLKSLNSPIILL